MRDGRTGAEEEGGAHPVAALDVVVVGMHRSGTSAVAAVLDRAGYSDGRPGDRPPALPENPGGFFERTDVVDLDDRLLAALGWTWDAPPPTPLPETPRLDDLVTEGRRLVRREMGGPDAWYLKDPRMGLLLPWWRRILLDRFVAVVPFRPAAEVAWSLHLRDGFSLEHALSLWAAYHRHMAEGLKGLPVVVVDYVAMTQRPTEIVPELLQALTGLGARAPLDPSAAIEAVEPDLRRATSPPEVEEGEVADLLRGLEGLWAPDGIAVHERFELAIDGPSRWEEAVLAAHKSMRQIESELGSERDENQQLARVARQASADLERERVERANLEARLREAREAMERQRVEIELERTDRADLEARLVAAREQSDSHRADVQEARSTADELRQRLEVATEEIGRASARGERVPELEADLRATAQRASEAEARLIAVAAAGRAYAVELHAGYVGPLGALRRRWQGSAGRHPRLAAAFAWPFRSAWRLSGAARQGRIGVNPLFEAEWYVRRYPETADHARGPWQHYRRIGSARGYLPNEFFQPDWYRQRYPDVARNGVEPLAHYLRWGAAEGRDPGPDFSTSGYLIANPDVIGSGLNPLLHYLRHGRAEGRHVPASGATTATTATTAAALGETTPRGTATGRPAKAAARRDRAPMLAAVAELARGMPASARLVLASRWDDDLLAATAGRGLFLARDRSGGRPDPGGRLAVPAAIALLEGARWEGHERLLLPHRHGWDHWEEPVLRGHLARRYRQSACDPAAGSLWALQEPSPLRVVDDLVLGLLAQLGRPLALLDWESGLAVEASFAACSVQAVPAGTRELPYLDGTFDIVVLGADGPRPVEEARRVAAQAVVAVRDGEASMAWGAGEPLLSGGLSVVLLSPPNGSAETYLARLDETLPADARVEVLVVGVERGIPAPGSSIGLRGRDLRALEPTGSVAADIAQAARAASHDLLAILDGMTAPLPGWIEAASGTLAGHPGSAAVTGLLLAGDGRLVMCGAERTSSGSWVAIGSGSAQADDPRLHIVRRVEGVPAGFAVVRRSAALDLREDGVSDGIAAYDGCLYDPEVASVRPWGLLHAG